MREQKPGHGSGHEPDGEGALPPKATYRPRLRSEVQVVEVESGQLALVDPATGNGTRLSESWERALPELLDGTRDLGALHSASAAASADADAAAPTEEQLRRFVKTIRYLRMTDDTSTSERERIRWAHENPLDHVRDAPVRLLPEARFGCAGSGVCCRTYVLGPLDPEDVARIESLPLREAFPHLDRPPLQRLPVGEAGEPAQVFLDQGSTGRCVFLESDERCGLHARFGAAAKPAFCQHFPHDVIRTARGIQVFDTAGCSRYGETAFQGEKLADTVVGNPGLYRRGALFGPLVHPTVNLGCEVALDFGYTAALERLLLRVVEHPAGTIVDVLNALRAVIEAFREAILDGDDAASTPEMILARVGERDAAEFFEGPEHGARARSRTNGFPEHAALLDRLCLIGIEEAPKGAEAERSASAKAAYRSGLAVARVAASLARASGGQKETPGEKILASEVHRTTFDPADTQADRRLRQLVRDLVFAKQLFIAPSVPAGLVFLGVLLSLVVTGGRLRAAQAGRTNVTGPDLDAAQFAALRLLRRGGVKKRLCTCPELDAAYRELLVIGIG